MGASNSGYAVWNDRQCGYVMPHRHGGIRCWAWCECLFAAQSVMKSQYM